MGKIRSQIEQKLEIKLDWSIQLILLSALILLVWAILKLSGIINTPLLIQMVPYVAGFTALASFAIACGKVLQKMDFFGKDLEQVKNDVKELRFDFRDLEKDMVRVKTKLNIS